MENIVPPPLRLDRIDEIPLFGDGKGRRGQAELLRIEKPADLLHPPEVVTPLLSLTIGIFRGIESPLRRTQVAKAIVEDFPDRPGMGFIAGGLKRFREGHRQKGLIVEHLLEVGHEPLRVGAVAVKAMTQLIEDPPLAHRGKGLIRHPERIRRTGPPPVAEQKNDLMGHGELRGVAESAADIVKLSLKLLKSSV